MTVFWYYFPAVFLSVVWLAVRPTVSSVILLVLPRLDQNIGLPGTALCFRGVGLGIGGFTAGTSELNPIFVRSNPQISISSGRGREKAPHASLHHLKAAAAHIYTVHHQTPQSVSAGCCKAISRAIPNPAFKQPLVSPASVSSLRVSQRASVLQQQRTSHTPINYNTYSPPTISNIQHMTVHFCFLQSIPRWQFSLQIPN